MTGDTENGRGAGGYYACREVQGGHQGHDIRVTGRRHGDGESEEEAITAARQCDGDVESKSIRSGKQTDTVRRAPQDDRPAGIPQR